MKTLILSGVVASLIVAAVTSVCIADVRIVENVQNGNATLSCHFEDGLREVPGERVTGRTDRGWEFGNGYAQSCIYKIIK